jgi:hypothetical protein
MYITSLSLTVMPTVTCVIWVEGSAVMLNGTLTTFGSLREDYGFIFNRLEKW